MVIGKFVIRGFAISGILRIFDRISIPIATHHVCMFFSKT